MATVSRPSVLLGPQTRRAWLIGVLGLAFAAGVHLDGWAHNHGRVDESFFTPWHAVLYAGYFALAAALVRPVLERRAQGRTWWDSIDRWERLALVGIVVFFAGGIGDMAWHTAFGVEEDLEALLSPTHLLLAVGGTFMGTAAYLGSRRASGGGWRAAGPAVLAVAALWSLLTFMTQFMHPLVELWPTPDWQLAGRYGDLGAALGAAGFVFNAAVASAAILVLARDDRLPAGAIVAVVGLNAAMAVTQGDDYWLAIPVVGGGLALEWLRWALGPIATAGWRVRVFGFAIPATLTAAVFLGLALGPTIAWSIDLWAGAIVGSGLIGALVSTVIVPPITVSD